MTIDRWEVAPAGDTTLMVRAEDGPWVLHEDVEPVIETMRTQNEYIAGMLDSIGRIPGVADRAGVGDGSVRAAVTAMYGALICAEAELDALRKVLPEKPWRQE